MLSIQFIILNFPHHCTEGGLFTYGSSDIFKLYLNVTSLLVMFLLLKHFPKLTLMLQCISWVFTYNLTEKTLFV